MNVSDALGDYKQLSETYGLRKTRQKLINADVHENQKNETKNQVQKKDIVVDLSSTSKELRTAGGAANTDGLRYEKIDQIKQNIKNGTYEINARQAAEKMIGLITNKFV